MVRFERLPGIASENTRRRNVLVGSAYLLCSGFVVGAISRGPAEDGGTLNGWDIAEPEAAAWEDLQYGVPVAQAIDASDEAELTEAHDRLATAIRIYGTMYQMAYDEIGDDIVLYEAVSSWLLRMSAVGTAARNAIGVELGRDVHGTFAASYLVNLKENIEAANQLYVETPELQVATGGDRQLDPGPTPHLLSDGTTLLSVREYEEHWFINGPRTFSGSGPEITDKMTVVPGMVAVAFEYEGADEFVMQVAGVESDTAGPIVTSNGPATGAVAVPAKTADASSIEFGLEIDTDGDWEVTIGQLGPPVGLFRDVPVTAEDRGTQLYGPLHIDESITIRAAFEGSGHFVVELIDEWDDQQADVERVFDEAGEFAGETTVMLDDWWGWIDVRTGATDQWSLELVGLDHSANT